MKTPKHMPVRDWPAADVEAFEAAYTPGDIFEDTCGPGAHLSSGTRLYIEVAYSRWLRILSMQNPTDLLLAPAERITRERARSYIEILEAEVSTMTVAIYLDGLHSAARLLAPGEDWSWLKEIHARLGARATPIDRFDQLVPTWHILDLGFALMDEAWHMPPDRNHRPEVRYRNGLILALLSLWPIRRRSVAALTLTHHVEHDEDGITLRLYPEDTKTKRAEAFRVPEPVVPYISHYLNEIRPHFPGSDTRHGFWASRSGGALVAGSIYAIFRTCVHARFGKWMGLHDIRRSAATFFAMDAPELASLIPGVLQHASSHVSEKHYILARSITASRRHTETIATMREDMRLRYSRPKGVST